MIRPATQADFQPAIKLIYSTIGKIGNTLAGSDQPAEVTRILEEFFQQKGNRLSYENTLVKEQDGRVVGVLVSYHGSRTAELDQPFLDRLIDQTGDPSLTITKEAQDDEYYLDTIAVSSEYEGRGYGKELMRAFEAKAHAEQHHKLALLVEKDNERAYRLYEKTGFRVDGELTVSGYRFYHMVKLI
ncbi:acetyltransferase (GNAT) family protein [Tumebacillus sp. BK434]|uniref:GNAT family N-acetyltransferase n=1 Tax=Tumebacillus sp. BK434 TaxID=2512169 RepID=UPI00104B3254|nr:GNAT family N-acetyltransferase [Tumebacillus sp. BK434]TCP59135.1 acetyltransferase (GNAT) family protein [Tumebacillus sp. BK434]